MVKYPLDPNVSYLFSVSSAGRDNLTLPPAVLPTTSGGKDDDSLPETSSSTSQNSRNLSPVSAIAPAQECSNNGRDETSKLLHVVKKSEESQSSLVSVPLQEPDVIASTKNANNSNTINGLSFDGGGESSVPIPVAPPRRKKKSKPQTPSRLTVSNVLNIIAVLPSTLICYYLH
jgi:hypothetical protein